MNVRPDGKGNLGCLLSLLVLGVIGYGLYKLAPPYVAHYQLKDEMKEIATYSAAGMLARRVTSSGKRQDLDDEVREAVMAKAADLQVPLRKQDISVRRGESTVYITVKYTVPVEHLAGVYHWEFEFTTHN